MTEKSSYKQILKSTSLFGGVKVIQILATIIRGKIVAVFLGTTGMGISSLLLSSTAMLQAISGLGLSFSAVREISQANETGDTNKLNRTITIFLKLLLFSSVSGALLLVVISPLLSRFTFGTSDYIWEFVWLSTVVFMNTLSAGYQALMQGTRRLNDIAKTSVAGSILSILTSFPIYYFWGIQGIVPAIIIAAVTTFALNYFFFRKIKFKKIHLRINEVGIEGSEMFKLGFVMMIVGVLGTSVPFLINSFIQKTGNLSDVGLYQAGFSLTSQYVSLVFTAMTVDYFPRLSAIHSDNNKVRNLANQQSEIMLLIVTPLIVTLILVAPLLIKIFLSNEFIPIVNFIRLMSIGLLFQAGNHSMGLISFAKGDKKTFLVLAVVGNASWLLFSIGGYKIGGLNGIGQMFVVHCIISFIIVFVTVYHKYNYWMSRSFTRIFILGVGLAFSVYFIIWLSPNIYGYLFSSSILFFSIMYSIYELDKRVVLKELLSKFKERYKNKR